MGSVLKIRLMKNASDTNFYDYYSFPEVLIV